MTETTTTPPAPIGGTYAPAPHLVAALDVLAPGAARPTGDGIDRWRGDLYPEARTAWRSTAEIAGGGTIA